MDLTTENVELTTLTTELSSTSDTISTAPAGTMIARNLNTSLINASQQCHDESQFVLPIFEGFITTEILMTALELVIACIAAYAITGWRRNYRNQMLMQLSVVRFVKRLLIYFQYLYIKGVITVDSSSSVVKVIFLGSQIYIDYVISILVCFFIKHMYDSLIIVIVKISRGNLCKVLTCSWLIPVPISVMWTSIIATGLLDKWSSYLLVCCLFRWPVMFVSTAMYVFILYRILKDDIRKYARSLTTVTFFLCLTVNVYLLFKDVIKLWCLKSYTTVLVSYILGFFFNLVSLCLYIVIIVLNVYSNRKHKYSHDERSKADVI